ncbi:Threonine dehydrogenase and related Zn-dependent dehydrogenases [Halomonas citrativorans]|uniref:Threonine dehydrogenase and related Zn-dependent dehydrogenases n=1 Tax=Halomonas citrativorans TaxID=2742612 RepID=A0A1R4I3P2_9GAMM|nr:Threonine dehydrogenase and related Zn-dependent dehydrogenases [Halomonas citrativorans]
MRYDTVPDPEIEHPRDAIINVSSCAICGSYLHLYDHIMPGMMTAVDICWAQALTKRHAYRRVSRRITAAAGFEAPLGIENALPYPPI